MPHDKIEYIYFKDKNAEICGHFNNTSVNWSTLTKGTRLMKLIKDTFFLY